MPFTPPEQFNLADHLLGERLEEGLGDRVALRLDDGRRTYAEVSRLADRFAHALGDLEVRPEERVVMVLPDGEHYVGALFGILRVGAVVVMLSPELPTEQTRAILGTARARVVVTAARHVEGLERACEGLGAAPRLLVVDERVGDHGHLDDHTEAGPFATVPTHRDDPAVWLFSGGTTGAPKAVVQSHRSFANTTALYAHDALGYRRDDVTISVPKLYFGYATGSNLFFPLSVGASAVLFDGKPTPDALFDRIARHGVTILVTVPKVVAQMVDHPRAPDADLSTLRFATSAGEALPPALHERWTRRFGIDLLDGIGTAEMWHIFCSNLPGAVKPGTLGRAVPGFRVEVRDADGDEVPRGEVGRLWVEGDSRAVHYWRNADQSHEAFVGRWYASSDLVSMDEDGYVTYVGRSDDAMKVGGKWLLPADVEGVLQQHEAVTECAVLGMPDDQGLTKPVAFVVAPGHGPELEDELQRWVLEHLEPYKHPRRVHVLDELPRTHLGKVDRRALRVRADD